MRLGNFYSDAKGILYVFTEKVFHSSGIDPLSINETLTGQHDVSRINNINEETLIIY